MKYERRVFNVETKIVNDNNKPVLAIKAIYDDYTNYLNEINFNIEM